MKTITLDPTATVPQQQQHGRVLKDGFRGLQRDLAEMLKDLSVEDAQRILSNQGALLSQVRATALNSFKNFSLSADFLKEEILTQRLSYPPTYEGPKPIAEQVDILAEIFGLSLGLTSEWVRTALPNLRLPDGADGWFAIPSIEALASRFFRKTEGSAERYCKAVQLVHEKLAAKRQYKNHLKDEIAPRFLGVHSRTAQAWKIITERQVGDIVIIPAQFGLYHAGRSIRRTRKVFKVDEFGLGAFHVGCMILTHPERFSQGRCLDASCPGDEFRDSNGVSSPKFFWETQADDLGFGFYKDWVGSSRSWNGPVSGFIPQ